MGSHKIHCLSARGSILNRTAEKYGTRKKPSPVLSYLRPPFLRNSEAAWFDDPDKWFQNRKSGLRAIELPFWSSHQVFPIQLDTFPEFRFTKKAHSMVGFLNYGANDRWPVKSEAF
ncbi:MAG: hypothetical protein CMF59_13075 [Leptospiraceae bacterium]|nr:hypothetical protein [Leptospiraceae bacterium]